MRKNSVKNTRINSEIQKALYQIIRDDVKDPRIAPLFSITRAEVTPDLKQCRVSVSVMGSEEAAREMVKGLKSAEGFIRSRLARTVNLRNTPELFFRADDSIAYGVNMSHLIQEVSDRDKAAALARGDEEPGGAPAEDE